MNFIEIFALASGGTNVVQLGMAFYNMKAQAKKEKELAKQEAANSVDKSQDIYDRLTERMAVELEKRDKLIEIQDLKLLDQNNKIFEQQKEIGSLSARLREYQNKCERCSQNAA